jgi:hypothetical protein
VQCVVGDFEEERTIGVLFDESHGPIADQVGGVAVLLDGRVMI